MRQTLKTSPVYIYRVIAASGQPADSVVIRALWPGGSDHRSESMTQYVGLDVSQKKTTICVVD